MKQKYTDLYDESTGKVGAIEFCWGGGMVDKLAADLAWGRVVALLKRNLSQ